MLIASDLEDNLFQTYGTDRSSRVKKSIDSIFSRIDHATFHIDELRKIEMLALGQHDSFSLAHEIMDPESKTKNFDVPAGAHAIAALQAIHSLGDLIGGAAIHSFEDVKRWKGYLKDAASKIYVTAPEIAENLLSLQSNDSYKYLNAATNESKHNNIVRTALTASFDPLRPNGYYFIYFKKFDKEAGKDIEHWPKEVLPYLEFEFDRQQAIIFSIISQLIEYTRPVYD